MNIVMITGSAHKNGTTAKLAEQFSKGAKEVSIFWGPDYEIDNISAEVQAVLEDGRVISAMVHTYNETTIYLKQYFAKFVSENITSDMTELDKVKKAAAYIGEISDYQLYEYDWRSIFLKGGGDCMASRVALHYMCEYMGITSWACTNLDYHGDTCCCFYRVAVICLGVLLSVCYECHYVSAFVLYSDFR